MWIVGDWGQASPWSRASGVLMTKGDDDVWTGELSLPKGTKFDIKILKSTVSATSGGDNAWSAIRYASTLNNSASHDFGEFTDNLIPNGSFEEGQVKWTPAECIVSGDGSAFEGQNVLALGIKYPESCASDVFVIPPNQTLRLTGYMRSFRNDLYGIAAMKVVTPQQQTLFEFDVSSNASEWFQFSKTFRSADVPMECQIVLTSSQTGAEDWSFALYFNSISLVSP